MLPEVATVVALLLRCRTQWERSPSTGARIGLPIERVEAMERRLGFQLDPDQFALLQRAEIETIGIDAERVRQAINR